MIVSNRDIERFLKVGSVMMLHTDPNWAEGPRYKTTLRGWRCLQHLILDRPRDRNGQYVLLQELGPCVIRFIVDGYACACSSQVISWDSHRASAYVRVRWPQELTHTSFRKAERVALRLSCRAQGAGDMQILDLSAAGCNVFSPRAHDVGAQLQLSFELPDNFSINGLHVCVRNVRQVAAGYVLGCEIAPGQEVLASDIAFFVTTTLSRRRTHPEAGPHAPVVLVVDPGAAVFEQLRQALAPQEVEAVWAGNVLDGMYRMRMLVPAAVFISRELPVLPAAEFCRIVRGVQGFEKLPLFVFGEAGREECERTRLAGATAFVQHSPTLLDDLVYAVTHARRQAEQ